MCINLASFVLHYPYSHLRLVELITHKIGVKISLKSGGLAPLLNRGRVTS